MYSFFIQCLYVGKFSLDLKIQKCTKSYMKIPFIFLSSKLTYINNRVRLMPFRKFYAKQNRMNYLKEDIFGIFTCLAESHGRINTNCALEFNIAIGHGFFYHNIPKISIR